MTKELPRMHFYCTVAKTHREASADEPIWRGFKWASQEMCEQASIRVPFYISVSWGFNNTSNEGEKMPFFIYCNCSWLVQWHRWMEGRKRLAGYCVQLCKCFIAWNDVPRSLTTSLILSPQRGKNEYRWMAAILACLTARPHISSSTIVLICQTMAILAAPFPCLAATVMPID